MINIEKGSLLEVINNKPDNTSNPISSESSELPGLLSAVKDKRLLSILQTNSSLPLTNFIQIDLETAAMVM